MRDPLDNYISVNMNFNHEFHKFKTVFSKLFWCWCWRPANMCEGVI